MTKHRRRARVPRPSYGNGRTPDNLVQKAERRARFETGRQNHQSLEKTCVDLAKLRYGITLYKADAERIGHAHRVTSGMPDRICALPPTGRFIGFEFKTTSIPGKRVQPRRNQLEVHEQIIAAGGRVFVPQTVDEFETFLRLALSIERDRQQILDAAQEQLHGT